VATAPLKLWSRQAMPIAASSMLSIEVVRKKSSHWRAF